jgi:hypothetical protein
MFDWLEPENRPWWVNALLVIAVVAGSLWLVASKPEVFIGR